jgi:hypothetical protein
MGMIWALNLNLHRRAVKKRVHSTFVFEFPIQTHKLEVMLQPWDRITETVKIPADETEVLNNMGS